MKNRSAFFGPYLIFTILFVLTPNHFSLAYGDDICGKAKAALAGTQQWMRETREDLDGTIKAEENAQKDYNDAKNSYAQNSTIRGNRNSTSEQKADAQSAMDAATRKMQGALEKLSVNSGRNEDSDGGLENRKNKLDHQMKVHKDSEADNKAAVASVCVLTNETKIIELNEKADKLEARAAELRKQAEPMAHWDGNRAKLEQAAKQLEDSASTLRSAATMDNPSQSPGTSGMEQRAAGLEQQANKTIGEVATNIEQRGLSLDSEVGLADQAQADQVRALGGEPTAARENPSSSGSGSAPPETGQPTGNVGDTVPNYNEGTPEVKKFADANGAHGNYSNNGDPKYNDAVHAAQTPQELYNTLKKHNLRSNGSPVESVHWGEKGKRAVRFENGDVWANSQANTNGFDSNAVKSFNGSETGTQNAFSSMKGWEQSGTTGAQLYQQQTGTNMYTQVVNPSQLNTGSPETARFGSSGGQFSSNQGFPYNSSQQPGESNGAYMQRVMGGETYHSTDGNTQTWSGHVQSGNNDAHFYGTPSKTGDPSTSQYAWVRQGSNPNSVLPGAVQQPYQTNSGATMYQNLNYGTTNPMAEWTPVYHATGVNPNQLYAPVSGGGRNVTQSMPNQVLELRGATIPSQARTLQNNGR